MESHQAGKIMRPDGAGTRSGHFPHLAFPVTRRRGDGASGRWGEWAKQIIGHFPFLIWHFPFRISDFFYFDDAGLPEIGSESKKMENEK